MSVWVEEELVQLSNRTTRHSAKSAWLAAGALVFGCVLRGESAGRGIVRTVGTNGMMATVQASEGVQEAIVEAPAKSKSGYVPVHGLKMYYEIHGTGKPLVLLHGALSTGETDFGKLVPSLAKTRQVILVEQQAHGHTEDLDRPLSYEQMAEDTAELLRQLKIENADFFGYSMGGGIALQLAMRHPELVRKFVFAGGASYQSDGLYPEIRKGTEGMKLGDLDGSPWQKAYARVAPQPANWPTLVAKVRDLDLKFSGWPPKEIQAVRAPALLIIGDSDIVRPEHTIAMFRLLGGGVPGDVGGLPRSQLAVLPGTTHVTLIERTDWLLSMIQVFLDAPMASTK